MNANETVKIEKRNVQQALHKLKEEVARKKQKMADEKKSLKDAKAKRVYIREKIGKLCASLSPDRFDALSEAELETKATRLKSLFDQFEAKCMDVNCHNKQSSTSEEDDETEALCEAMQSKILARLKQLKPDASQNAAIAEDLPVKQTEDQMPVIANICGEFSGNIYEWHKFSKRFKSNVHEKEDLSDADKLDLLKKTCTETALQIVLDTEDDYESAWSRLNDMYGEAYTQMHYCVHRLLTFPQIMHPSAESFKKLIQAGEQCEKILKDLMNAEKFDAFMTVMLTGKLDEETNRAWDRHRKSLAQSWAENAPGTSSEQRNANMHVPSFNDLSAFLKDEINLLFKENMRRSLQAANIPSTSHASSAGNTAQNNLHKIIRPRQASNEEKRKAPSHMQCTLCELVHARYKCDVYLEMQFVDKWRHVENEGLCVKCLKSRHGHTPCDNRLSNEKCPACYQEARKIAYHNSTLCPVRHKLPAGAAPDEFWDL